ncbi:LysE family transporter [Candidatus Peregrinibacteria bacterium]|nr:LysE family transporter [Candidatus Peregrinibacteria bacterium]
MLFVEEAFIFGFTQSFVIGPLTLLAIREGLNPKRGIFYQIQVVAAGTIVDTLYLLLALHGAVFFINDIRVQAVMWTCAAFMLTMMGLNSLTNKKKKKISYHRTHRHHLHVADTSFGQGFMVGLLNPISIIFWVMIAGSMYSQYLNQITPLLFTSNIIFGGLFGSIIIVVCTFAFRKFFNKRTLQRLVMIGSVLLIGYGLWFTLKALTEWQTVMASIF